MQTGTEPVQIEYQNWVLRAHRPENPQTAPVLVLVHGWTGDETVMWIFARKMMGKCWLLAPRGPVQAPSGGYGWLPLRSSAAWHTMEDFQGVAQRVAEAFPGWAEAAGIPKETAVKPFNLMGFSQGAALSYALAAHYPHMVDRIAALAGYLPAVGKTAPMERFSGKPVYIAHGTQDDTVPVTLAQEAVQALQSVGAQVTYCESNSGHKLSTTCLRDVETFLGF